MAESFEIEPIIRLYEPRERAFLEVGEDPDTPALVQLRTVDKLSAEYFGDIRLTLTPERARQLAAALLEIANKLQHT